MNPLLITTMAVLIGIATDASATGRKAPLPEERILSISKGAFIVEAGGHRIAIDSLHQNALPAEGDLPPSRMAKALEGHRDSIRLDSWAGKHQEEARTHPSEKMRSLAGLHWQRRADAMVQQVLDGFEYLNLGLVRNGKIVFLKAYGSSDLETEGIYASVSKPLTATILMKFLAEGRIRSLDDNIWDYSPTYLDCMPDRYKNSPLTFRQLLSHRGGITHREATTWKDGKLNLLYKPGTSASYSTGGYGILGHVLEDIAGESYESLVRRYIADPVGAKSFKAWARFAAPGAGVSSTIEDMARFTMGVMDNTYLSSTQLYDTMLKPVNLGWQRAGGDGEDLVLFHPGTNGRPVAFMALLPRRKISVVAFALSNGKGSLDDLRNLSFTLLHRLNEGP